MSTRLSSVLVSSLLLASCATSFEPHLDCAHDAPESPLVVRFSELDDPAIERSELAFDAELPPVPLGIRRIALATSACLGSCPVYTVELYDGGEARFTGHACVRPLGTSTGRFDPGRFDLLAELVSEIGFFELADGYASNVTDLSASFIAVSTPDDDKIVMRYWAGPARLWALELAIREVVREVTWGGPIPTIARPDP